MYRKYGYSLLKSWNKFGSSYPYKFCQNKEFIYNRINQIQTTARRDVSPLIGVILRPVSRVFAVLVGRGIRKWWNALPSDKKALFIQHFQRQKYNYAGGSFIFGFCGYQYYESHTSEVPFTKRKRFMIFNSEQLHEISLFTYEDTISGFQGQLFPENHPLVQKVMNITNRLLQSNKTIAQLYTKTWTITVIDSPIENCVVLSSGHIIMFRGMMDLTESDDQLAHILAHEMSHAILGHTAEKLSQAYLVDLLFVFPLAFIWSFLPNDGIAAVTHWFMCKVLDILVNLPFSRLLETEADIVGLMLTARACYDVRDASAFWGQVSLMDKIKELRQGKPEVVEWLSTHPSHQDRQLVLDHWMPKALSLRHLCQCPELKSCDPRAIIEKLQVKYGIDKGLESSTIDQDLGAILLPEVKPPVFVTS